MMGRDGVALASLMGSSVRVHLRGGVTSVGGVLYGVDPESGDVALVLPSRNAHDAHDHNDDDDHDIDDDGDDHDHLRVKMVLGHAVMRIERDDGATDTLESLLLPTASASASAATASACVSTPPASTEDKLASAQRLASLLTRHLLPHEVSRNGDEVRVLGGAAVLRFPFQPQAVESDNAQILRRLEALLRDFHGGNDTAGHAS